MVLGFMGGPRGQAIAAPSAASVELDWVAPGACPARARVLETMRARLGDDPAVDPEMPIRAWVRVQPSVRGLDAQLRVTTPGGLTERSLSADDCETIVDAAVLIVAMSAVAMAEVPSVAEDPGPPSSVDETALGPAALTSAEPAEAPLEPAEARREPADVAREAPGSENPVERAPKTAPPRSFGGQVRAGGGVGLGGITAVAGNLSAGGGVSWSRWQFDAVGRLWFSQRLALPQQEDLGADVRLWSLGPRGGPVLRWRRFEFPVQLGLDVGRARARGYGLSTPRTAARTWLSVGVFPAAVWSVTRHLGLGLGAEMSAVLLRPRFAISDAGLLPRVGGLLGGFSARIQVRFP